MAQNIGPRIGIDGEQEYRKQLENIIQTQKTLNSAMKETASAFDKTTSEQEKARAKFTYLSAEIDKQREKIQKLNELHDKAVEKYGAESTVAMKYEKAIADANTELNNMEKELKDLPNAMQTFGNSMQSVGNDLSSIGENMKSFGSDMTKYVTGPIAALGTASVTMASDYEDALAKVSTISDDSVKSISEISEELMELSDASGKSVTELSEATYQALSASVDTADAVSFVAQATDLAKAGFLDTADAVDVLTTIINAYGMEASDAQKIADELVQTQNDGKTTVSELAAVMGTVIPTAAAYNVSMENLNSAYVIMTKQGINAANATTYLSGMFTELADEGSDVAGILQDKTGKSFGQLMDDGESLGDVLEILYDSVDGNSEAFANLWGNVRAGRGALAIANGGAEEFNDELNKMNDSAGNTAEALEKLETPSVKAQKALNRLKNSSIKLGQQMITDLEPTFNKILEDIEDFTHWFSELDEGSRQAIIKTGALVAAIGPLLSVGGQLFKIAGAVSKGLGTATSAIGTFTSNMANGFDVMTAANAAGVSTAGVIGGVAAAYLGLGAAAKVMQDDWMRSVDAEWGLTEAMKEHQSAIESLSASHEALHENTLTTVSAVDSEFAGIESLIDSYNKLIDQNGQVIAGKENTANFILNQLSSALGIERTDVEALIDANGKLSTSIQEVIDKKKAEAILAAYEDEWTEAIQNRQTAANNLASAQADLTAATHNAKAADDNYQAALANYNALYNEADVQTYKYRDALSEAALAQADAKAALEKTNSAYKEAQDTFINYNATYENYEGLASSIIEGDTESINLSLEKLTSGFLSAETANEESLARQLQNAQQNLTDISSAIEAGTPGVTEADRQMAAKMVSAAQQELDKLRGLAKTSAESAGNSYADGISSKSELAKNKAKTVAQNANEGFKSVSAYSSGSDFAYGYGNGIADSAWYAQQQAEYLATSTLRRFNAVQQINSPSRLTKKSGGFFGEGYAIGIRDEVQNAMRSASLLATQTLGELQKQSDGSRISIGLPPAQQLAYAGSGNNSSISVGQVLIEINGADYSNTDELADAVMARFVDLTNRENEVFK